MLTPLLILLVLVAASVAPHTTRMILGVRCPDKLSSYHEPSRFPKEKAVEKVTP